MASRSRWLRIAMTAIVAAILYLPGLGRPALWEPDEGRYAEIAREMALSGDLVTPRNDYVRYFEKPPLVYWTAAAAIRIFGTTEFAVRLPAALFTAGQAAIVCAIGEVMFGAAAGLLGALALALSPLVFAFARFATLDPALAFFLSAAMGAFLAASRAPDFGAGAGRRWMLASAAMLALGTLVKGPVALVLGGAIALVWMLAERRTRELARMPLVSCAIVYLAIVMPWFVIAEHRNPGFLEFFFVHEHLERYMVSQEHGWGPWFFIPIVIGGAWPWIFFAPLGWLEMRRTPEAGRASIFSSRNFLAAWFAVILIFFSIPRSKLGSYILPAMPPLAILAGYGLGRLRDLPRKRWLAWMRTFAGVNSLAAAAACVGLYFAARRLPPGVALDGALLAAAIAAGAIAAWLLAGNPMRSAYAIAAIAIAMILTAGIAERARADAAAAVSYRELARGIAPYLGPGCILGSYHHYVQALPFYTATREMPIEYWGELAEFAEPDRAHEEFIGSAARMAQMWSTSRCFVIIANRHDLAAVLKALPSNPKATVIACEGKKLALFNGPAPRSSPSPCSNPSPCKGEVR
ncbi:MAG TPA: phospholipid carrier-dependent glycosyltransferase [Candidatus Binataceae bacterium]|nr:phospholipid carrier-dependent glycosyltransferase [Candidatus Binataceae bacterium]